jgi:SAM-dependent methyltransferase
MEHLPEPDLFLGECHRILEPGGRMCLTVPFMWHVHEEPYDYYRYTEFGLKYLLEKRGFVDVRVEARTGFWQMWVLKFNYHTSRLDRFPFHWILARLWWMGQKISPILDRYDRCPEEAAGYAVSAKKPACEATAAVPR